MTTRSTQITDGILKNWKIPKVIDEWTCPSVISLIIFDAKWHSNTTDEIIDKNIHQWLVFRVMLPITFPKDVHGSR